MVTVCGRLLLLQPAWTGKLPSSAPQFWIPGQCRKMHSSIPGTTWIYIYFHLLIFSRGQYKCLSPPSLWVILVAAHRPYAKQNTWFSVYFGQGIKRAALWNPPLTVSATGSTNITYIFKHGGYPASPARELLIGLQRCPGTLRCSSTKVLYCIPW